MNIKSKNVDCTSILQNLNIDKGLSDKQFLKNC